MAERIEMNLLRAAISQSMFFAEPDRALPRKKKPTQQTIVGLLPKMFARCPVKGIVAAADSAYAAPTHTNLSPPLRSWVMTGSAVDTAVMSRALRMLQTRMDE